MRRKAWKADLFTLIMSIACLVAMILMSGCKTVDIGQFVDEADALQEWFKTFPDIVAPAHGVDPEDKFKNDIPIDKIAFHGKRNPANDKVTHDLHFEGKFGGQVRLVQTATKDWATDYDVVGTVWLLLPRKDGSGMWDAYQTDYIRPGQTLRHWPWDTPRFDGDYPPVGRDDSFGVVITTLARDNRTNGEKRTRTVKVQ